MVPRRKPQPRASGRTNRAPPLPLLLHANVLALQMPHGVFAPTPLRRPGPRPPLVAAAQSPRRKARSRRPESRSGALSRTQSPPDRLPTSRDLLKRPRADAQRNPHAATRLHHQKLLATNPHADTSDNRRLFGFSLNIQSDLHSFHISLSILIFS